MRNDALLSLAHSIYTKKGVYALILGSGVLKGANAPSVNDIINDLITKAHCKSAGEYPADPCQWYRERFKEEPTLSKLLDTLAHSPTERELILKNYYKDPEDSLDCMKPAAAHRVIARLVKNGYIKVIITTCIDTLLEEALADEGITPEIVANDAQADSMIPLPHSICTVIKVNGDFSGISDGLTNFNNLFDRIIDEFGTVVCGWPARLETGLINALLNAKARRFATYWIYESDLTREEERVAAFRRAETIEGGCTDEFLSDLENALNTMSGIDEIRHPISIETACTRIKQWLPNPVDIIMLNDLVMDEACRVSRFKDSREWVENPKPEDIKRAIVDMETAAAKLTNLLAIGCYWGRPEHNNIWKKVIETLMFGAEKVFNVKLHFYIPMQVLYTVLISALANCRYELAYLALNGCYHVVSHNRRTVADTLFASSIMEYSLLNYALDRHNEVPISESLFDALQAPCSRVIHTEDVYETLFDKAEYLIHLNYIHRNPGQLPPQGRFSIFKRGIYVDAATLLDDDASGLAEAGFFGGELSQYSSITQG